MLDPILWLLLASLADKRLGPSRRAPELPYMGLYAVYKAAERLIGPSAMDSAERACIRLGRAGDKVQDVRRCSLLKLAEPADAQIALYCLWAVFILWEVFQIDPSEFIGRDNSNRPATLVIFDSVVIDRHPPPSVRAFVAPGKCPCTATLYSKKNTIGKKSDKSGLRLVLLASAHPIHCLIMALDPLVCDFFRLAAIPALELFGKRLVDLGRFRHQ